VTFTATVSGSGGIPTGTVDFFDGSTNLGSGTLNSSGVAAVSPAALSIGGSPHSITAVYSGNSAFGGSTSSVLSQIIDNSSTTTVASSQDPALAGSVVTFTATVSVSGGIPTGTVAFFDGNNNLGGGTLNSSGQAAISTAALSFGGSPHSITAVYSGNGIFGGSTSTVLSQILTNAGAQGITTGSITDYGNVIVYGDTGFAFTLGGASWFSSPVPYVQPDTANSPGIWDVLANGNADAWTDVGAWYSGGAGVNGEFVMVRKFWNDRGEIDVESPGTGVGRPLVLQNTSFGGVAANGGSSSIGFNAAPIEQYYALYNTNGGDRFLTVNPNTGAGAYSTIEAQNTAADENGYTRIMSMGTGFANSGIYLENSGLLEAGSDLAALSLLTRNSSAPIIFATGGSASSNERMRITQAGNVGIGTTTPGAALTVNGQVIVSNIITSSNIFYPLTGSGLGADMNKAYTTNFEGANFSFTALVNVNMSMVNSCVMLVSNTSGSPIMATGLSTWATNAVASGGWSITNLATFTFTIWPGMVTNVLYYPMK
jgi:hypothetical protein